MLRHQQLSRNVQEVKWCEMVGYLDRTVLTPYFRPRLNGPEKKQKQPRLSEAIAPSILAFDPTEGLQRPNSDQYASGQRHCWECSNDDADLFSADLFMRALTYPFACIGFSPIKIPQLIIPAFDICFFATKIFLLVFRGVLFGNTLYRNLVMTAAFGWSFTANTDFGGFF